MKTRLMFFPMILFLAACSSSASQAPYDWKSDWAVEDGFALRLDTAGYRFPTAIAFVPNPGQAPKDPLYYVTELAGAIKVVTNDRSVYIFADGFDRLKRERESANVPDEIGTAGICLEPQHGYIFATMVVQDSNEVYRNRIIRFETKPNTFAIQPMASVTFTDAFSSDALARTGHQIGPCQIKDNLLYIGIGDGQRIAASQRLDTLVGKIARMTLDGLPAPENPFRQDDDPKKPINYVWASGFRNPFGFKIVGDRFFVADNGNAIDRFLEIRRGENYLWDGSDWSIGSNADFVIAPSVAPVQMDYAITGLPSFPDAYAKNFYLSGYADDTSKKTGIVAVPYSLDENRVSSTPRYLLRHRSDEPQAISGLAIGPDGLYFAMMLPDRNGVTAVYRIAYEPSQRHPHTLDTDTDASLIIFSKGCQGCHILKGSTGTEGPRLDRSILLPRIQAKLNSESYRVSVQALDQREDEPFRSHRAAREAVLAAKGTEQVQLWLTNFLQEPRFDNPNTRMPNLDLTEAQASAVADYLLKETEEDNPILSLRRQIITILANHLILFSFASFLAGGACFAFGAWARKKIRARR